MVKAAPRRVPAGSAALVPIPTYAMYGVLTGQRAARIVSVPRLGADRGYQLDVAAMLRELSNVQVVWLCSGRYVGLQQQGINGIINHDQLSPFCGQKFFGHLSF